MKRRLLITSILTLLLMLSLPIVIPLSSEEYAIIYGVFAVVSFVLILVYLFSGTAKFIILTIYIVVIVLLLIFLREYQHPIMAIGTLMIVLNPLANFERFLEKNLEDESTQPLRISIRGKYWPFYEYRQAMKDFVRLPQTKKLYTKSWYLRTRQIVTLLLLFASIYLFMNELKNIYFDLTNYNMTQIFTFYGVLALFMLTFILFKNGFTAMFRATIMFMFIPIIYVIALSNLSLPTKIIFSILVFMVGLADVIYEKINSLNRVAYNPYKYFDTQDRRCVYANSFYEPFVYNESYSLIGHFKFRVNIDTFHQKLHDVLFYANRKHFMISAYTYDGEFIEIYTDFYHKHMKKVSKFSNYLEALFEANIHYDVIIDKNKQYYEKNFFHKTEYIVARALSLAELLDDLSLESSNVIISMIFSFEKLSDMQKVSKHYYTEHLSDLDDEHYYAARITARTSKSKFAIEQKVRDMLLTAMMYRGNYVRILVYYDEGEN